MAGQGMPTSGTEPLTIHGGRPLRGGTEVAGFKHSFVTLVAAAAVAEAPLRITNCPGIAETSALAQTMADLGAGAKWEDDTLTLCGASIASSEVRSPAAAVIHGTVYLLPALLARLGKARVPTLGGCQVGDHPSGRRPVEQYISILERFGASATLLADGTLAAVGADLRGCEIDLLDYTHTRHLRSGPLYSGATKMAVLLAAVSRGPSLIHNPYPKPDVTDVVTVLRQLGADIEVDDRGSIVVRGRGPGQLCRPAEHALIPDLIEVVTWICASAILGGEPMTIHGANMSRAARALAPEREVLDQLGVQLAWEPTRVTVQPADRLRPVDITVHSHGVFSDSQPFLTLLASLAPGDSTITETVWGKRFGYATGLAALNMNLAVQGQTLRVHGPWRPRPATTPLHGTDLRASAALLLAALAAPGVSTITGTHHLVRGYRDLVSALRACGADISTPEVEAACA